MTKLANHVSNLMLFSILLTPMVNLTDINNFNVESNIILPIHQSSFNGKY